MERWSLSNYQRARPAGLVNNAAYNSLTVLSNQEEIEISLPSSTDTQKVFEWLSNPEGLDLSPGVDGSWIRLANELDRLGYLREIGEAGGASTAIDSTHRVLLESFDAHAASINSLREHGVRWTQTRQLLLDDLARGVGGIGPQHSPIAFLINENFYLSLLRILLRSWMRGEPATLLIAKTLLEDSGELRGHLARTDALPIPGLDDLYAFGPDQTIRRLHTFSELLGRVFKDDAQRIVTLEATPHQHAITSLNAAIEFESLARQALLSISQSGAKVAERTATGTEAVIQQYFVDERFVETIAPAVARNLSHDFKRMFRRYLVEELGHEEFDVETCAAAGIDESDLRLRTPLALTDAFCDVYVLLASEDLLAYVLSIVLTEGLPSDAADQDQKAPDLSQLSGVDKHNAFNALQHHQYISRWLARSSGWITPQRYAWAARIFLFLLELNHRLWRDIQSAGQANAR